MGENARKTFQENSFLSFPPEQPKEEKFKKVGMFTYRKIFKSGFKLMFQIYQDCFFLTLPPSGIHAIWMGSFLGLG